MKKVFSLYLNFLQTSQSESLQKHVFASWRAFIRKVNIFHILLKSPEICQYLKMCSRNDNRDCVRLLQNQSFPLQFQPVLFKGNASLCGDLCYEVFTLANSACIPKKKDYVFQSSIIKLSNYIITGTCLIILYYQDNILSILTGVTML